MVAAMKITATALTDARLAALSVLEVAEPAQGAQARQEAVLAAVGDDEPRQGRKASYSTNSNWRPRWALMNANIKPR
jgi:hypothetical protein